MGRPGPVLVELSVVEQRYHAVMEVAAGVPVTQVAARYGVSRQSVHSWVRRYELGGLSGLADRSHRPGSCPHRIPVEVDRTVNAVGFVGLGGDKHNIGWAFAGQRVTLRLDGRVLQVLDEQRVLQATLPCPLSATACGRLRGARPGGPAPSLPEPAAQIAERTVSAAGGFVLAGQRVQLGRAYAGLVVQAHLDEEAIRIFHDGELVTTVPRTTRKTLVVRKSGEHHRRKIV